MEAIFNTVINLLLALPVGLLQQLQLILDGLLQAAGLRG